jgi:hypothetical protein
MAYITKQAIGIRFGIDKRWEIIDLTAITVPKLLTTYRIAQIELAAPNGGASVYLDVQTLMPLYANFPGKFADLLFALGNESLPTTTTGIVLNHRKALFRDAFRAGYSVTPVNEVNIVDPSKPDTALPNVRLSKENIDYAYAFKHCLVSVNGFYHRTDTDGVNGLMVTDAMNTLNISGQNQIGLLSFAGMCSFDIVPITPSMIDVNTLGMPVITMNQDMNNKSLILVVGGYMTFVDNTTLSQIGTSSYKLDMTTMKLVDRFYDSSNYIDLTNVGITPSASSATEIAIADLTTGPAVVGWLTLSQSFAVVLDTPSLYTQRQYMARSGMPNLYFSYVQPNDPLVLELGRHPSYWSVYEDKQWRLSLYDNVVGNELYYTNPLPTWLNTAGGNMSGMPNHLSQAYLLEIGRDY